MSTNDFTTTVIMAKTPAEVFNAINNVRGWWSEEVEGGTEKLNDEFHYHYKDVHSCTMRLIEVVPEKKVVWLVLENYFNFVNDQTEWKDTKVIFELSEKNGKTQLKFTHQGLVPAHECFEICSNAWTGYIQDSLVALVTNGKGKPNPKETESAELK